MIEHKRSISFNEQFHQYTDEYNKVYTSVTTVIQNYYPKFDEEKWSKHTAETMGISQSAVKQLWKDGREFACEKGTKEHKLLEDSINESKKYNKSGLAPKGLTKIANEVDLVRLKESPLGLKYPKIYSDICEFVLTGYVVYVEKRVYWAEFLIAGTIDCLLVRGKFFRIFDWKTNKDELKFKSGYYKKVNGIKTGTWIDKDERFFHPLQSLPNCKGSIYTMQLSLYAYLLELWGYTCEELRLYHIRDIYELHKLTGQRYLKETILTVYSVVYEKQLCQLLTIDHKNALNKKPSNNNDNLFFIT